MFELLQIWPGKLLFDQPVLPVPLAEGTPPPAVQQFFLIATYPAIFNYLHKMKLCHLIFLKDGMGAFHAGLFLCQKRGLIFLTPEV